MELTKYAAAIKTELAMELVKQGSSLAELEETLQNINTGAGVYKLATTAGALIKEAAQSQGSSGGSSFGGVGAAAGGALGGVAGGMLAGPLGIPMGAMVGGAAASTLGRTIGDFPELAFKASLGGGALAGLGLDEMDKSVDSLNKALEREREKVNLVRRITNNLKREHGLN